MVEPYTQVAFLIHFVMKEFGILTSVLSERQTLGFTSYYDLGLLLGTMTGHTLM